MDPRPLSLGQTLRAAPSGTAGVYLNPAVLAMVPLYHIELMYQYTGREEMHTGGLAVVDSVTSVVAAGLSFNYSAIDQPRTRHVAYDGRLALAGSLGDVLFLGATGRYLHLEQNKSSKQWGPAGKPALPASGSQQVDGFTFDVGAALRAGSIVTIGVVGYNLTHTGSVFAPLQLGSGVSVSLAQILFMEFDAVIDFTSHDKVSADLNFGTEVFLGNRFAIRGGYMYDIYYNLNSITAGLGYVGDRFAVDGGYMQEIEDDGRFVVCFAFKYFIN